MLRCPQEQVFQALITSALIKPLLKGYLHPNLLFVNSEHLEALREQGLRRELRRVDSPQSPRIQIGGETFLNFSSNDYLGLSNHPALKEAAIKAVEKFGAGAGASRLICGSLAPFHELEETLAAFKGTEAALTFSTGYAAALGTITASNSACGLLKNERQG